MADILFAVQDEPNGLATIQLVADFFARRGHRTTVTTDGAVARAQIQAGTVDVILVDVMLPHRDGLELVAELRRRKPGQKTGVVVLGMVTAEVGSMLPFVERFSPTIDAMIIKPYSGDLAKLAPRRPLNYHEQLIVTVGQLVARLETPADTSGLILDAAGTASADGAT